MKLKTSFLILIFVLFTYDYFYCRVVIEGKMKTNKTVLSADGNSPGTYALVNIALRGTFAIQVPDCLHPDFGPHIRQIEDAVLKGPVFAFYLHVSSDGNACARRDRQRNEIAVNKKSPEGLKGFQGETVVFSWDFQLPLGFQASGKFTHVHQIKVGDGSQGNTNPLITLSIGRYTKTETQGFFEVTHYDSQNKLWHLKKVHLTPFLGVWVHVLERITYGGRGMYEVSIKTVKGRREVLSYRNDNLDLWRSGSTFYRPKWGIYRCLNDSKYLRDERVLYNNFCFSKLGDGDLCE